MTETVRRIGENVFVIPGSDVPMSDREAKAARQAAYIAWLVLPKGQRVPSTKKAVAELLGVTTATLLNYEKEPAFRDEVQRRLGAAFRVDRLADVFEALYVTATSVENPRSVAAARTLIEWSEKASGLAGIDLSGYSDEELETARAALGL